MYSRSNRYALDSRSHLGSLVLSGSLQRAAILRDLHVYYTRERAEAEYAPRIGAIFALCITLFASAEAHSQMFEV